jgi:hypothetical protein
MDERKICSIRCHLTLILRVKDDLEDNLTSHCNGKLVLYIARYSASCYADAQRPLLTEANAPVQASKADSTKL